MHARVSTARLALWAWTLAAVTFIAAPATADDAGFTSIFDGKSLTNWDGNPEFWRVEDGAIVGQTTAEKPTKGNTFIIWRGGELGDFELKAEFKIEGGNSGIQYRSFEIKDQKWVIGGYQADIDSNPNGGFTGIVYGEKFRGILAQRGTKSVVGEDHKGKEVGKIGDAAEIVSHVKKGDWNEYHITGKGFTFVQKINGVTTAELTDDDKEQRKASGLLALQLHAGPPMKVQFRNIRLKKLPAGQSSLNHTRGNAFRQVSFNAAGEKKQVLLLAGRRSHGFGAHDHTAGCSLLAKLLNASGLPVEASWHSLEKDGWPSGEKLSKANTVIIYADGGGGHPFNAHLDELNALTKKGVGIGCIHYGVETTKGPNGDAFLEWTGGYFEPHWSVNPHWTAQFKAFPAHPICRGVKEFAVNDEWYYHMRFRPNMDGVTAILTDLPTEATLTRPDGAHSGNPDVRAAVKNKEPQHMCWARERADGGRGFGFTGGHVHWNWGNEQFRRLMLNAIVWSARVDVPENGVPAGKVGLDDLLQDHDEAIPANFDRAKVEKLLSEWAGK